LCEGMVAAEDTTAEDKAPCTACKSGYVLEDGKSDKSCIDTSDLSCGKGKAVDLAAQCTKCSSTFDITEDGLCARHCYACGDVEKETYVDKSECAIDSSNSTDKKGASLVECLNGICYIAYKDGKVMGGCLPSTMTQSCSGDMAEGEVCTDTEYNERCHRCCSESKCNTFFDEMDGVPDSAIMIATNLLLICATALVATHLR